MKICPIVAIPGAFAREDGAIKLPESTCRMPRGGMREYKTKWVFGFKARSSKTARHTYMAIVYRGKNYKMHRLICEAFHGEPKPGQVVLHLDEDATNNRPDNLRWGSQKENLNATGFIEYCKSRTGENSPTAKWKKAMKQNVTGSIPA
jgi:hypothetical protein